MTVDQLISTLKDRYESADKRELSIAIHLFGIEFCDLLKGQPVALIAESAIGHRSYATEIRKGMKLAKFVTPK
jgi:hypothetical protein